MQASPIFNAPALKPARSLRCSSETSWPRSRHSATAKRANAALSAPDVLERLRVTGNEAVASTPDAFEQRFKADLAKFAKIVKEAHIPAQD